MALSAEGWDPRAEPLVVKILPTEGWDPVVGEKPQRSDLGAEPLRPPPELAIPQVERQRHNQDGHSALLTNYLYFDAKKRPKVNSEENNRFRNDGHGFLEDSDGVPVNGDSESPKKVLILKSDTGGGHRAFAEDIKAAFREEYRCSTMTKFS
ncbi:Monogalactosyldiacylglycerol synthase [Abeliophyllum distichum]|uniref:Monogalactosyldiacylglycerol synthase n=1 Tax=Abeliophyllum distichum TaxID=126358 RepID=A0ABD1VUH3_9LAMI